MQLIYRLPFMALVAFLFGVSFTACNEADKKALEALKRRGFLTGWVYDFETRLPVTNATVKVYQSEVYSGSTTSSGVYKLEFEMTSGVLTIEAPGYQTHYTAMDNIWDAIQADSILVDGGTVAYYDIALYRNDLDLSGHVVTEWGQRVSDIPVFLWNTSFSANAMHRSAKTDAAGKFEFKGLRRGYDYLVFVPEVANEYGDAIYGSGSDTYDYPQESPDALWIYLTLPTPRILWSNMCPNGNINQALPASNTPCNNAIVGPNDELIIVFNRRMDTSSLVYHLRAPTGEQIPSTASWQFDQILTITPSAPFSNSYNLRHELRLTSLKTAYGHEVIGILNTIVFQFSIIGDQSITGITPRIGLNRNLQSANELPEVSVLMDFGGYYSYDSRFDLVQSNVTTLPLIWDTVNGAVAYQIFGDGSAQNTNNATVSWQSCGFVNTADINAAGGIVAQAFFSLPLNSTCLGFNSSNSPFLFDQYALISVMPIFETAFQNGIASNALPDKNTALKLEDNRKPFLVSMSNSNDFYTECGHNFKRELTFNFNEAMRLDSVPTSLNIFSGLYNMSIDSSQVYWQTIANNPTQLIYKNVSFSFANPEITLNSGFTSSNIILRSDIASISNRDQFYQGQTLRFYDVSGGTNGTRTITGINLSGDTVTTPVIVLNTAIPANAVRLVDERYPFTTLAANANQGSNTIVVAAGTGQRFSGGVNQQIRISSDNVNSYCNTGDLYTIAAVTGDTITLTAPLNEPHIAGEPVRDNGISNTEIGLRGRQNLTLTRSTVLSASNPTIHVASVANIALGDTILIDLDGQIGATQTLSDRVIGTVAAIASVNSAGAPLSSPYIVLSNLDMPASSVVLDTGKTSVRHMGDSFGITGSDAKDTSGNGGLATVANRIDAGNTTVWGGRPTGTDR